MNERSLRESLSEKEAELKEQLESIRDEYERAVRDRDQNNQAVEGLQKALQEVQNRALPCRYFLTNAHSLQYEDQNSKSLWRHTNRKSMSSGNRSRPQKRHQRPPKHRPKQRKRTWNELCRLRRKSRRRTCSSESYDMKQ